MAGWRLHSDHLYAHDEVVAKVAECFVDSLVGTVYGDLQCVDAADTQRVVRHWRSSSFGLEKLKRS